MTDLLILRHGPTAWNTEGLIQGRTDIPLSPEGEGVVRSWVLPDRLRDRAWVASPLKRAAATAAAGLLPAAGALDFVFRAITPDGRPRRFDARFFLVDAAELVGDLDDFSRACDELSELQWIPLPETRSFNLPFVTEVVLGEISRAVREGGRPASVPFFDNRTARSVFSRIG